jgi:hypothetical protein
MIPGVEKSIPEVCRHDALTLLILLLISLDELDSGNSTKKNLLDHLKQHVCGLNQPEKMGQGKTDRHRITLGNSSFGD